MVLIYLESTLQEYFDVSTYSIINNYMMLVLSLIGNIVALSCDQC